ncbi:hypothetical protein BCV69DRAFT_142531 [Microstroma glucosiphilum]|uniref:Uncharacterized protein n=1 Tax=Pseudomicrostroma glucosiphilum TaxID=1684307 RepID=A0A316UAZ2_9BASI|nr:hypothetical protein BCV69DRAFT_142531 [Pseudomicrostroma glucosiphilum]PWN22386.1 hypothetical protein BCV69DRAFT_142531 [Pseudomicrostroma glucosiphilum]
MRLCRRSRSVRPEQRRMMHVMAPRQAGAVFYPRDPPRSAHRRRSSPPPERLLTHLKQEQRADLTAHATDDVDGKTKGRRQSGNVPAWLLRVGGKAARRRKRTPCACQVPLQSGSGEGAEVEAVRPMHACLHPSSSRCCATYAARQALLSTRSGYDRRTSAS